MSLSKPESPEGRAEGDDESVANLFREMKKLKNRVQALEKNNTKLEEQIQDLRNQPWYKKLWESFKGASWWEKGIVIIAIAVVVVFTLHGHTAFLVSSALLTRAMEIMITSGILGVAAHWERIWSWIKSILSRIVEFLKDIAEEIFHALRGEDETCWARNGGPSAAAKLVVQGLTARAG